MKTVTFAEIFSDMRSSTENIYHKSVNQVIDYISANLHKPMPLDRIAEHIHVSQRQLLRIMRLSLNESLSAYIARQRIERAVMYMQTEAQTLVALAEKVGYDNPQSFSKAFKKQFGIPPKVYMNELQSRLKNLVTGGSSNRHHPDPEICEENGMDLVYIRIIGKYGEDEPYETAWNKLVHFLKHHQALNGNTRFIGISFDDPNVTNSCNCRFYACATVQKPVIPTGEFGVIQLQKGKYAVYTLKGSYAGLQDLYNHISVSCPYPLRHGAVFEEYLNCMDDMEDNELITKVFIPIK